MSSDDSNPVLVRTLFSNVVDCGLPEASFTLLVQGLERSEATFKELGNLLRTLKECKRLVRELRFQLFEQSGLAGAWNAVQAHNYRFARFMLILGGDLLT